MSIKLANIGFGNIVAANRIIAIVSPESAPIKRIIQEAREKGMLVDATYGRRTRAVIITDSDHVILSAVQPETVAHRPRPRRLLQNRLTNVCAFLEGLPLKRGFLVILSGPSGAGKNTVLDATMDRCSDLQYSVSATTRPRRKSEQDGVDYFFLTEEEFQRRVRAGEFLEWAEFCGHLRNTLSYIEECLEQGHVVVWILISKERGKSRIKCLRLFCISLPPTMAELENRLRGRSTDSDEAIRQRLGKALEELKAGIDYDYVILNDKIAKSAAKLEAIITAERCRVKHSEYFELLEDIVGRNRE